MDPIPLRITSASFHTDTLSLAWEADPRVAQVVVHRRGDPVATFPAAHRDAAIAWPDLGNLAELVLLGFDDAGAPVATAAWPGSLGVPDGEDRLLTTGAVLPARLGLPTSPGLPTSTTAVAASVRASSPTSAPIGIDHLDLTLYGSGFAAEATVSAHGFGSVGSALVFSGPLQVIGPTQARVALPGSLFVITTFLEIVVTNRGAAASNPIRLEVAAPGIYAVSPTALVSGRDQALTITGGHFYTSAGGRQTGAAFDGVVLDAARVKVEPAVGRVTVQLTAAEATAGSHALALFNPTPSGPWYSNTWYLQANAVAGPQLSAIAPSTAGAGRDDLAIVLTGTNLAAGATVLAAGTVVPSTITNGALQATLPRTLLQAARAIPVSVVSAGVTSNALTVSVVAPAVVSVSPTSLAVGQAAAMVLGVTGAYTSAGRATQVRWDGTLLTSTLDSTGARITAQLPATLATAGPHQLALVNPTDAGTAESAAFAVTVGGSPAVVSLATVTPGVLPLGRRSTVAVTGTNLPADAAAYAIVDDGQPVPGVTIESATVASARTNGSLLVRVEADAAAGGHLLRAQVAGASASVPIALARDEGSVFAIPTGERFVAIRYGLRNAGRERVVGVLSEQASAAGVAPTFATVRLYGADGSGPTVIQSKGPDRFTDFLFVDFEGVGADYVVGIVGRSQDPVTAGLLAGVVVIDPRIADPTRQVRMRPVLSTDFDVAKAVNPNFGEAVVADAGPGTGLFRRQSLLVVPQNSFLITPTRQNIQITKMFLVHVLSGSLQATPLDVPPTRATSGDTIERTMSAIYTADGRTRIVVFSKSLVVAVDASTGAMVRRQVVDPLDTSLDATSSGNVDRDVPNPEGETVQGRRYGQFQFLPLGKDGALEMVVAAHSLPSRKGFYGMYTLLPVPAPRPSDATAYLPPQWGSKDTLTTQYRFFRGAVKKSFDKDEAATRVRLRFVNGAELQGGTPYQGIGDLGDGQPTIVVSDAPTPATPGPGGDALTPLLYVLNARTGKDHLTPPLPNVIALDVLRRSGGPARVVAWSGVTTNTQAAYAGGTLEIFELDGPTPRPVGRLPERQPVLFNLGQLVRTPTDIASAAPEVTHVLARPIIGASDSFLTYRPGTFPTSPEVIDAYDVNTLAPQLVAVSLEAAVAAFGGRNARLVGLLDDEFPRQTQAGVLPGHTFVVLSDSDDPADLAAQRLRLFGVSMADRVDERGLVPVTLATTLSG
jgi:hypothetical protein